MNEQGNQNPAAPAAVARRGADYWRSLEHLADTPEIRDLIGKEFPGYDADEMVNSSRRRFLKLAGASMALAGLTLNGCRRWPEEKLAPFSTNPRGRMPGVPEQFATAMEIGGVAQPLLVTSYDGRPIKVEGNPSHPFAWTIKDRQGAADAYAQASVLEMYDPHRSRNVVDRTDKKARDATWEEFAAFATKHFAALRSTGGTLAILSEATLSPSVRRMKDKLLAAFPKARWYEYEPISHDAEVEGAKLAFGKPVRSRLHLEKASRVVLLDADVLGAHPAHVRYAADWVARRRPESGDMSRIYMAEAGFSITGSVADMRIPVDPSRLYAIARAMAASVGVPGVSGEEKLSDAEAKFVTAAVADLKEAGKAALVAAGPALSPAGHALIYAINQKLGAIGNTVALHEDPLLDRPTHAVAIADLANQMKAGTINTLLILGGNPAYDAPADLEFDISLPKVPTSIRLGLYDDETSNLCTWHVPRAHYLEAWGDARAWDGTAGIIQPLIMPLYGGKSIIELLAFLASGAVAEGHEIVLETWKALLGGDAFEATIRRVIEAGSLEGSAFPVANVAPRMSEFPPAEAAPAGLFVRFQPDSHVYDGRFSNNGWLQETPDPLTKLMWDNAALISKKDADSIGVSTGDMVQVTTEGKDVRIAAYVMPGQPVGVITLPLGYGRTAAGHIGDQLGFNTYAVRTTKSLDVASGAKVSKLSGSYKLVSTQDHHILDTLGAAARAKRIGPKDQSGIIIHEATFAQYKADLRSVHGGPRKVGLQLFEPPHTFRDNHAWGMAIDLNACIGCNACALACQAENNIPIVGKVEADNHRVMNWIRIDRYFKGDPNKGDAEDPSIEVVHQPMMCQHCETAPCEEVCPVGATVHDSEGLNTMVYNRCIGTRYCSNNCPYKVRRFNYFDYHSKDPRSFWGTPWPLLPDQQQNAAFAGTNEVQKMMFNPEVSIRMRGVMEKCTYCVQRIHLTRIAKRAQGQDMEDGDIVTACQQSCPTQAIIFGDLNDPESRVSKLHKSARSYGVLDEELNTRPRTQYLARIRNPIEQQGAPEAKA